MMNKTMFMHGPKPMVLIPDNDMQALWHQLNMVTKMAMLMRTWKIATKRTKLLHAPCLPPTKCFEPCSNLQHFTTHLTATHYIQDADSDNNTVTTSKQLGRKVADAANPTQKPAQMQV